MIENTSDVQFARTPHLTLSSDIGAEGPPQLLLPGEARNFTTRLSPHLLGNSEANRMPAKLPLDKDRPALGVVKGSFGASLKSRYERAGLNMNGMQVIRHRDGSIEIGGNVTNNGTAAVNYDPQRMYRLYTVHDSPLSALGRTAATIFDPSQSVPAWAEEFIAANEELLQYMKGYDPTHSGMPLSWRLEAASNGALAFVVPLGQHYVMNPDHVVDVSQSGMKARDVISPHLVPINHGEDLMDMVGGEGDTTVQVISDTPPVRFPPGWFGLVTTATAGTNPYKDGFNVGGWTVPYNNAQRGVYVGERPAPPHGGSNFIDEGFEDAIATEALTTPRYGLPSYAAILASRM